MKRKKNECEVRRHVTMTVEYIEKIPKKDYEGVPSDVVKKDMAEITKKLLGADAVTITKVKDFVAE